jgi:hypothetical protein
MQSTEKAASVTRKPRAQLEQHHTAFASFHEAYVRSYIALADTKAAVIFAVASSLVAYLFSNAAFHALLFAPTQSWATGLACLTSAALICAAGFAAWVIAPRTPHTGEGLVFFGAVRAYPNDAAYVQAVRNSSEAELTEARLRHCYNVSDVCWKKYRVLRSSIWSGVVGLALLPAALVVEQYTPASARRAETRVEPSVPARRNSQQAAIIPKANPTPTSPSRE